MVFRTAGAIATLLLGLGASGGQALAQYYPPAQAYPPPQAYPLRRAIRRIGRFRRSMLMTVTRPTIRRRCRAARFRRLPWARRPPSRSPASTTAAARRFTTRRRGHRLHPLPIATRRRRPASIRTRLARLPRGGRVTSSRCLSRRAAASGRSRLSRSAAARRARLRAGCCRHASLLRRARCHPVRPGRSGRTGAIRRRHATAAADQPRPDRCGTS